MADDLQMQRIAIARALVWTDDILEPGWRRELGGQFKLPYFYELLAYLAEEASKHNIYPPPHQVFSAFEMCPLSNVRVVIVGQDPYHGPGQAHGLAFSVPTGTRIPSSLRNVIAEAKADQQIWTSGHGNLKRWAAQGVLLLNTTLTVREGQPNSHRKEGGWSTFTDYAIQIINENKVGIVFLLWGKHAQRKCRFVDEERHHVLKTSHPSGLSCYRGFRGSKCFSKTNEYLESIGGKPIDWSV